VHAEPCYAHQLHEVTCVLTHLSAKFLVCSGCYSSKADVVLAGVVDYVPPEKTDLGECDVMSLYLNVHKKSNDATKYSDTYVKFGDFSGQIFTKAHHTKPDKKRKHGLDSIKNGHAKHVNDSRTSSNNCNFRVILQSSLQSNSLLPWSQDLHMSSI